MDPFAFFELVYSTAKILILGHWAPLWMTVRAFTGLFVTSRVKDNVSTLAGSLIIHLRVVVRVPQERNERL